MKLNMKKIGLIIFTIVISIILALINLKILPILILTLFSWLIFYYHNFKIRNSVIIWLIIVFAALSRMIFVFVPEFNPVIVITIICGVIFKKNAGILCGAMSILLSSLLYLDEYLIFFQMLSLALSGYFAGILHVKLAMNKYYIYGYSVVCSIGYWLIINVGSCLKSAKFINISQYLENLSTSISLLLTSILASLIFMFCLRRVMFQILNRVKNKYGIMENENEY